MNENMTDIESGIGSGAVNVYQGDMTDEFPVLKAFQQYIDAEQAKSRKRLMLLCVFFCFVLTVVIGVFLSLLLASSARTQSLNDRLVEYAMKDRERAPVVAQPNPQENAALQALTSKLEALQNSIADDRARAERVAAEAFGKEEKRPTVEALEIERLKALLAAEKEKAAAEREKQRQAELEEYRRKHYPELYGLKPTKSRRIVRSAEEEEADREIESIISEVKAVRYFDDEDEDDDLPSARSSKRSATKKNVVPFEDDVETPRGVRDSSGNVWNIPEE